MSAPIEGRPAVPSAGHVRPFHCYPAVCLPNARVLRSLGAPLAFERFSFVFLGSGRHQLGPALAFPDRLNPLRADWFHSCTPCVTTSVD